jgi:hypothetical protein
VLNISFVEKHLCVRMISFIIKRFSFKQFSALRYNRNDVWSSSMRVQVSDVIVWLRSINSNNERYAVVVSSAHERLDNSLLIISIIKRRLDSDRSISLVLPWSSNKSVKNFIVEFVVLCSIGSTFKKKKSRFLEKINWL